MMQQLTLSELNIDMQEAYLLMGYNNISDADEDIRNMIDEIYKEISKICKPAFIYKVYDSNVSSIVSIEINGSTFKPGKMITSYLEGMEKCCVFVTTAGLEYDLYKKDLRARGELMEEFIADSIGSVIAEACVEKISKKLQEEHLQITYPYSPGYCGWKLTEQKILFSLLPPEPCGVTLTDSSLMLPIKSISGIMGIGKHIQRREYGCKICDNINCYKRKISVI